MTHSQWVFEIEILDHFDHPPFSRTAAYKSWFTKGKLYTDFAFLPPKHAFLEDFLQNGPQIYSKIDKWMQVSD